MPERNTLTSSYISLNRYTKIRKSIYFMSLRTINSQTCWQNHLARSNTRRPLKCLVWRRSLLKSLNQFNNPQSPLFSITNLQVKDRILRIICMSNMCRKDKKGEIVLEELIVICLRANSYTSSLIQGLHVHTLSVKYHSSIHHTIVLYDTHPCRSTLHLSVSSPP